MGIKMRSLQFKIYFEDIYLVSERQSSETIFMKLSKSQLGAKEWHILYISIYKQIPVLNIKIGWEWHGDALV